MKFGERVSPHCCHCPAVTFAEGKEICKPQASLISFLSPPFPLSLSLSLSFIFLSLPPLSLSLLYLSLSLSLLNLSLSPSFLSCVFLFFLISLCVSPFLSLSCFFHSVCISLSPVWVFSVSLFSCFFTRRQQGWIDLWQEKRLRFVVQ